MVNKMKDKNKMICIECDSYVKKHESDMCKSCRDIEIKRLKEYLKILES